MKIPLVIAHRGDSSNALENSLEAVHKALSYPADMIELDVRKSRDNGLYVMHDKMTLRTAWQNINIEHATSDDIANVTLRNGEAVPTLTDIIKVVAGRAGLNLEIKSDGAGLLTADYLASSGYQGYVLISSFREDEVLAVRRVIPTMPTSAIFDVFSVRDVGPYRKRGYSILSVRKNTVNEKLVAACHEQGVQVYVWTVDEDDEMQKFISWEVDGIYTNKPGDLKETIKKMEAAVRD